MRTAEAADVVPGEARFLERLIARMGRPSAPPMMILSRGLRYQGPVIQALLEKTRETHGADGVLHVTPPYSEQIGQAAYFRELGRQCGFTEETGNSTPFTAAFDQHLKQGKHLFLLISGFENANEPCRRELAGTLRTLTEKHLGNLRVALFGGQRLLEQKYGAGRLSFLSHAELEEWPDPDPADVLAWQRREFPHLDLDAAGARQLLDVTGGHAGQVRGCLEQWDATGGDPTWAEWSYVCPELWETWCHLSAEAASELRASLTREHFGPALPWPPDSLVRRLYWTDLLKGQGRQLAWRSEIIRCVGREVLA